MLALACAAAVSGCAHELPPEALELLDSGRVACQNGQYAAAVERMDRFLAAHEDADRAGEAYYYRGLARYRLGRYEVARADLDTALDEADDERVALAARVALGDLAYDTGDIAQAERRYREAADQIDPGEPLADHVRYRLGCVLQRQGRWEEAALHFRRVVHYFTDSELARRSERRAPCRAWTVQAGAFRDKDNADKAAALTSHGLEATVQPVLDDEKLLFLVTVGRSNTYEGARELLPKVREYRKDAFVTTVR